MDYILFIIGITTTSTLYSCVSKDTVIIAVAQVPTSSFSLTDSTCMKEITSLSYTGNATTGANYVWNFNGGLASPGTGQGPQQTVWINAGSLAVSLSVSENGCSSTLTTDSIIVKLSPVSNAGTNSAFCSGESVVLGTTSIPGYTYLWSPTIGLTGATTSNPALTIINSGTSIQTSAYIVTTTFLGCSIKDTVQVSVYPLPVADFSFSNVCLNQTLNFNDQSADPNGTITNWEWNPGDGIALDNNQNISHVYTAASNYSVQLSVVSSFGCSDSVTKIQ